MRNKIPLPAGYQPRLIPPNATSSGRGLSWQCSIFVLGQSEHCQLTVCARSVSFLGTRGFLVDPPLPGSPLRLAIGVPRSCRGLALSGGYPPDPHLEFEALPGLSGMGLVTFISRVGDGVGIPLPRQLQVSKCQFLLCIYSTDIYEAERTHPGPLRATFDPRSRGVKIRKIAIAPDRGA